MARLSGSDYRGVLEVLAEAGAAEGPTPVSTPVLEAIRRLVPCDVVAYHEDGSLGKPAIVFAGEPRGPMTPEIRAAARRYRHQDPIVPAYGARTLSDFLTRREYHRRELYQLADRPLGIEYMMRLWLEPGVSGARLEFDRATREFGERDRAVLDVLLPHLVQLRRRAQSRRRASGLDGTGRSRLTPREREILFRVAEGRTNAEVSWALHISPGTVRKHLENAYAKLGVHTRTAAVAALLGESRDPEAGQATLPAPRGYSSVGRAPGSHPGGRRFESG